MKRAYRLIGIGVFALVGGCVQTDSSTPPFERGDNSLEATAKDFDAFCAELSEQMIRPFRSAISIEKNIFELNAKMTRGEITEKEFDLVAEQIDSRKEEYRYWGERWRDSGCVNRLPVGNSNLPL